VNIILNTHKIKVTNITGSSNINIFTNVRNQILVNFVYRKMMNPKSVMLKILSGNK
jgi:hypothetical protein